MNRAYRILTAGVFINLCLGVLYAWSVISKALVSDLGWSATEAGMPYTISVVTFALGMVVAGVLQDRMGPRLMAIAGAGMVGTGMLLSSFATTPVMLMITFGLLVGTGIGFTYSCLSPTAMKWFHPSKKGMVNGLLAGGFGIAPLFLAPLSTALIGNFGINQTFLILGIGVLLISIPLAFTIVTPAADYKPEAPAGYQEKAKSPAYNFTWNEMVKTPQFYMMFVAFAFAASAGVMLIGNIANIAALQGNISNAAMLVSILAVANTLGRIFMGMLSDKIGRTQTLVLAIAIQTLNMVLFPMYTTMISFIGGAILAGIGYGALLSVFPSLTADYYGIKNYGSNFGVLFLAWGASGFMGPVMAGYIFDTTGSFGMAYMISAVMLVIAGIMALMVKPVDVEAMSAKGLLSNAA